jgi:hypothetical protein
MVEKVALELAFVQELLLSHVNVITRITHINPSSDSRNVSPLMATIPRERVSPNPKKRS